VILRVVLGGEFRGHRLRILLGARRGERAVDEGRTGLRRVHGFRLGRRDLGRGGIRGLALLGVLGGGVLLGRRFRLRVGLGRIRPGRRVLRRRKADAAGEQHRDGRGVQKTGAHGGPPEWVLGRENAVPNPDVSGFGCLIVGANRKHPTCAAGRARCSDFGKPARGDDPVQHSG
jgi:hypothetical protein